MFDVPTPIQRLRELRGQLFQPLRHWAKQWIVRRLGHALQMGAAFLRAQLALQQAAGMHDDEPVGDSAVAPGSRSELLAQVWAQNTTSTQRVSEQMQRAEREYPRIMRVAQTQHTVNVVLRHQRLVLQRAAAAGELEEADAARLIDGINRRLKQIYLEPMRKLGGSRHAMLQDTRLDSPQRRVSQRPMLAHQARARVGTRERPIKAVTMELQEISPQVAVPLG